ncbi:MAG: DUF3575 domain-containing protein [Parabacteroides sp.]
MRQLYILLVSFLLIPCFYAQGQDEGEDLPVGDAFLFTFQEGDVDIQSGFGNNTIELERLNRRVWPSIAQLMDGEYHLLIVSHIHSETGSVSKLSINTAAWRASLVRRYLKNKYALENRSISFYVDRSGNWGNSVHVYLLYFPMPEFANKKIFFSDDQSSEAISAMLKRYDIPPYIYVMNDPDLVSEDEPFAYVVINNKAELPYEEGATLPVLPPSTPRKRPAATSEAAPAPKPAPVPASQPTAAVAPEPRQEEPRATEPQIPPSYPVYQPFNLTVRTNLLSWATLTPGFSVGKEGTSMKLGATMPNLELEYAFGGWGSILLGGTYSRFSYKGNPNNLWGVSSVLVEPRLWFDDDGAYRGFNVGLQLKYGNFNVRENDPIGYGQTGQFFAAGVMLNYLQPIYRNLAFEAGVGFGTRMVFNASVYERDYDQQISQTIQTYTQNNFMINVRLALVYRFGFR